MFRKLASALFALCFFATSASAAGWWAYESGAWKSVTIPETYQSGAWHAIQNGYVYEAGAWHLFFASLSVSASDVSGITIINVGSCASPETGTPGTTVTGGSGSYSYSWSFVSGDAGMSFDPNNTVQNPKWFPTAPGLCTGSGGDAQLNAVYEVVVTDTVTSATTNTSINVHLEYNRP
jgi:hypothetical protein